MALSALEDGSREPQASELDSVLGETAPLWWGLVSRISENHAPVEELWHHGGTKYGWTLRLRRKGRVILYMTPQAGGFLVGLVLGEKAVSAARELGLPARVMALVEKAPRYSEGRGFRMTVTNSEDVLAVVRLAGAKMAR